MPRTQEFGLIAHKGQAPQQRPREERGVRGEVLRLSPNNNEALVELSWDGWHVWRVWVKRDVFGVLFQ